MKLSKRILVGVLAAALISSAFGGCGEKKKTADDGVTKVTVWRNSGHDKAFFQ